MAAASDPAGPPPLSPSDLDRIEKFVRDGWVEHAKDDPVFARGPSGVLLALVAQARRALPEGRTGGEAQPKWTGRCPDRLHTGAECGREPTAPIVGAAEPTPAVVGKVEPVFSQLVPFDANTPGLVVELNGVRFVRAPRWIPVEERLPDENRDVLALLDDQTSTVASQCEGQWAVPCVDRDTGVLGLTSLPESTCVTHWMPLPAPPEVRR